MSHTSCLPSQLVRSYLLPLPPPSPILHPLILLIWSLYLLWFFLTSCLIPTLASLPPPPPPHFFCVCLFTSHSVEIRWKMHGSATPIMLEWASLFLVVTPINERSIWPGQCSITFAGLSPWGAQHEGGGLCVMCVSAFCVLLPLWVFQPGLQWS